MVQDALRVARVDWTDAAQAALERAQKFDTTRGLDSVAAMRHRGALLLEISQHGKPAAWYVLEQNYYPHGSELVIAATAGRFKGRADVAETVCRFAELQAVGNADVVMFQTKRKGLIKKCAAIGWSVDGIIMRKSVNRVTAQ